MGERPPGDGQADQPDVDYWSQVEQFELLWERHTERWPEKSHDSRDDQLRPGDPAHAWRGEGGRYLSPEQNAQADELIGALRAPEEAITEQLQLIEQDIPHGGYLAGLEYRLKGDMRLKEKIADEIKNEFGANPADAVSTISDAVRYTFCFSKDECVSGYGDVRQRLESAGYRMTFSKNHWLSDPQYKGINTRWQTPDGNRFELQFHIPESLHAKEHLTHRSYERLRLAQTFRAERRQLNTYQSIVSAAVPEPPGIRGIQDHEEGSRCSARSPITRS